MKFCITARGETIDSEVDPRFGRAKYFLMVNSETEELQAIPNSPGAHGAGVQAAQTIVDNGVNTVITGSVGPNAFQSLNAANISVYTGAKGTVRQAIDDCEAEQLTRADKPDHGKHGGKQQ